MGAQISIGDLFLILLSLAGITALVYLAILFNNLAKTVKNINERLDKNKNEIDKAIKSLPAISENLEEISNSTNIILQDVQPGISSITKNVDSIVERAKATTGNVTDTVNFLSSSVAGTTETLTGGIESVSDYLALAYEIFQIVRSVFGLKKK